MIWFGRKILNDTRGIVTIFKIINRVRILLYILKFYDKNHMIEGIVFKIVGNLLFYDQLIKTRLSNF